MISVNFSKQITKYQNPKDDAYLLSRFMGFSDNHPTLLSTLNEYMKNDKGNTNNISIFVLIPVCIQQQEKEEEEEEIIKFTIIIWYN